MREQEKDLFQGYEIKNWNFSPRLYKILGAAAIFNVLTILVMGQADIFTTRGCDSPFVGRVCQVIDTLYVGSVLLSTDSEFVSKDYEKTELEDSDITYIDVSGQTPPLKYPEGYFALANPESEFAAMQNTDFSTFQSSIPGIPTNPTMTYDTDLMNQPQVTPTPNKNAVTGTIPTEPYSFGGPNPIATTPSLKNRKFPRIYSQKLPKIKNGSPSKLPNFEDDVTTEKKDKKDKTDEQQIAKNQPPIESEAVKEVEINKKPFEELGDSLNDKLAKKEVDLDKPFSVILDGTISADGKLDSKKSKFGKSKGDEQMVEVAKQAIEAVGNSGFLGYLKNIGVDKVNFTIVQNDKEISVIILSDQKIPEKADSIASSFNILLSGLIALDKNGIKKLDENSKTLVNNSKVTSEGKNFKLNFVLPKKDAQDLINRSLKDRAEKKAKQQQPNSSAELNNNSNTDLSK
ncbi:MAG: hypothetical protein M3388_08475 [Acidobacteriota bacterium]|nr:hypothetical protein [Acidobacteriota bacterium]